MGSGQAIQGPCRWESPPADFSNGVELVQTASPKLPVVPQLSRILGQTIAAGQGSSFGSLDFKVALPAMLTRGVSTIALSAHLLRLPVQVQQGCS